MVDGFVKPSIATSNEPPSLVATRLGTVMTEPITAQPPEIAVPATVQGVGLDGLVTSVGQVILSTSVASRGLLAVRVKV